MDESQEVKRLAEALRLGRVVTVVGAGLSAATTQAAPCSTWLGFLRSGIKFASDHQLLDRQKEKKLTDLLDIATEGESDLTLLLSSAQAIGSYIANAGEQAQANWYRDTIGELEVRDPGWIDAIVSLHTPILTTNYDNLIEQRSGRVSVTRSDPSGFQAAVTRSSDAIVHLHGLWSDPASIVLTPTDYTSLETDATSAALQKALSATESLLYIGFGSGINDPNFSQLLQWHRQTFRKSTVEHFRLCRREELDTLKALHCDQNITPIAYGLDYGELPAFIGDLPTCYPAGKVNDLGLARNVPAEARERIIVDLTAELNLEPTVSGTDSSRSLAEILVDPVLLPSPHSEYVSRSDDDPTTKRLDPFEEASRSGVVIVVGEEHSGLTTTLRWLALQGSSTRDAVSPLYLNFKDIPRGSNPLDNLLRRQAIESNVIERRRDPLPPNIIALDDFNPFISKVSENALCDIAQEGNTACTFIGCRPGDESRTAEILRGLDIEPRVRYVGKVNKADVTAMAQIVAPLAPSGLIDRVVTILRSERLPRSPFTVQLLLEILLRGEEIVSTPSLTGVLEQYLSVLLGRGDPSVDSRYAIGVEQGLTALSAVAHLYAERGQVNLPETDVVARLEEITSRFSWSESPSEMLQYFRKARILRVDPSGVSFVRSSYLHLLAARWADRDAAFCEFLQLDPLRYSKILRHYAGMRRSDSQLLYRMLDFLSTMTKDHGAAKALEPVAEVDAPRFLVSDDTEPAQDRREGADGETAPSNDAPVDELDALPDTDREPFPEISTADTPYVQRLAMALESASAILRDSDEVEDLDVKQKLLRAVLNGWGEFIAHMSEDHDFQDLRRAIVEDLRTTNPDFAENNDGLVSDIFDIIPCAIVAGEIERHLASRKLLRTLGEILADEAELPTGEAASAALLLFFIREPGWIRQAADLGARQKNSWIFVSFLPFLYATQLNTEGSQGTDPELVDEIAERLLHQYRYKSHRQRVVAKEKIKVQVRRIGYKQRQQRSAIEVD
ncbi:MAG: SIR2 family protein [Actinomycetia bacterium]|nr:SIR2 family protein [Actinomycetes bacterium]